MAVYKLDEILMRHVRENVIRCTATCVEIVASPFRNMFYLGVANWLIIWYLGHLMLTCISRPKRCRTYTVVNVKLTTFFKINHVVRILCENSFLVFITNAGPT